MTYNEFRDLVGGIESAAKIVALGVGGYWAYTRFLRQPERYSFIEFRVDIAFIGRQQEWWIVELIADIKNLGKVQHKIRNFEFDLSALLPEDKINTSEGFGGQVIFPREITRGSWLPKKFTHFFIDPGTQAHYSYIARIPPIIEEIQKAHVASLRGIAQCLNARGFRTPNGRGFAAQSVKNLLQRKLRRDSVSSPVPEAKQISWVS